MSWYQQVIFFAFLLCDSKIQACSPSISAVQCVASKLYCSHIVCNYTLIDRFSLEIKQIGCTLKQNVPFPKLRIKHEMSVRGTKYRPGRFDHQFDVCALATGLNVPVLQLFIPKENLDLILHSCPYRNNETVHLRDYGVNTKTIPQIAGLIGLYRMTFSIKNNRVGEVFALKVFGNQCVK